ncbi:monooxygenase family protein [Halostreptopolyspora alba]|uniref:monooxygenase family protein n=1 Tax=Halostreptopolyspora alba TaxID=2487137 RepID=UPI0026A95BCF
MTEIASGTTTTEPRETLTLFLLGFRANALLRPRRWWWLTTAFREMEAELLAAPERGLLHSRTLVGARGLTSVQYWRSTEELMRYAHESGHARAWREFYRRRDGSAGIWHEVYEIGVPQSPDSRGYEAIYVDIPRMGLGRALGTRPVTRETRSAGDRLARAAR